MNVKLIENNYFLDLIGLVAEMYKAISTDINSFQSVNTLIHMINNEVDFKAIGLFEEDTLIGFVTGHQYNEGIFLFTGIYVDPKHADSVQELIEFCFAHIQEQGYKGWEADATNANISSILERYGASVKYTRYRKEFE